MIRIGSLLHRAGAGLLAVFWLNVATASVVACAFGKDDQPAYNHAAEVQLPAPHGNHHSNPALETPGGCGVADLLVVGCIASHSFETPVVSVAITHPVSLTPQQPHSLSPTLDPPPPRA